MRRLTAMTAMAAIVLTGTGMASAAIMPGTWEDTTSDLLTGTWEEMFAGPGQPGQPGAMLSAEAADAAQWALGGVYIVDPPVGNDNGDGTITYTTDYWNENDPGMSSLTLGAAPTLWGDAASFTSLMVTVEATIDIVTREYLGGTFTGHAEGMANAMGYTIAISGTLSETGIIGDPAAPEGHEGTVDALAVTIAFEPAMVPLDIKPGSCPNPLNRKSRGVLPLAILGTETFDVSTVDLATVQLARADGVGGMVGPLEGPPGPHSHLEDVGTPFEGEVCECHEMEADGFLDLAMKFRTPDVVSALELWDLEWRETVELVVSGYLTDGMPFVASDCVVLRYRLESAPNGHSKRRR